MQSAWEKLTDGRCNNAEPLPQYKPMTIREMKEASRASIKGVTRKFDKITALNECIDSGGHIGMAARKDKRKMADSWTKAQAKPGDLHNKAAARAAKRAPVTITRVL